MLVAGSLAACQSADAGPNPVVTADPAAAQASAAPTESVAQLEIVPADGATDVRLDAPVSVAVTQGTVLDVHVTGPDGADVAGHAAIGRQTWASTGALRSNTAYTVTSKAVDDAGRQTSTTSTFTTLTAEHVVDASILPRDGWSVGVGMPIIVSFDRPVHDKAAVERRLSVTTTPAVTGAWRWESAKQVQWRPREYWVPGTTVTVDVDLPGVEAAPGVWGGKAQSSTFQIGSATVSTVDIAAHTLTITRDGAPLRTIPITTGKDGYETRNGTKVIISRETEHRMDAATLGTDKNDPDYYNLVVKYAMRLTWSGEFIHAAPWSVGQQGSANVSHGCTGMSTADAKWLFEQSKVGDVVTFVGGQRSLEWGNGYTAWEMGFEQWAQGSALR